MFPDQFTMKFKNKKNDIFSFFGVFWQFGTPYFSKFYEKSSFVEKEAF